MEALYLLIPLSILVVFAAIWLFFRMSDGGQFDDMVGPALRILQDDDGGRPAEPPAPAASANSPNQPVAPATGRTAGTDPQPRVDKVLPNPADRG